jgi:hypothetical protein
MKDWQEQHKQRLKEEEEDDVREPLLERAAEYKEVIKL